MSFANFSPRLQVEPPQLEITSVEFHVLLAPDFDQSFTHSAQDNLQVVIPTVFIGADPFRTWSNAISWPEAIRSNGA
jgi:hypothetical protein